MAKVCEDGSPTGFCHSDFERESELILDKLFEHFYRMDFPRAISTANLNPIRSF